MATLFIVAVATLIIMTRSSKSGENSRGTTVDPASVEVVRGMFPQVTATSIAYDLMKTGSIERTTEKLIAGISLPEPPASSPIRQQFGRPEATQGHRGPSNARNGRLIDPQKGKIHESLLHRYDLLEKIEDDESCDDTKQTDKKPGWINDRKMREEILRKRREKMVLQARRRLIEHETSSKIDYESNTTGSLNELQTEKDTIIVIDSN